MPWWRTGTLVPVITHRGHATLWIRGVVHVEVTDAHGDVRRLAERPAVVDTDEPLDAVSRYSAPVQIPAVRWQAIA